MKHQILTIIGLYLTLSNHLFAQDSLSGKIQTDSVKTTLISDSSQTSTKKNSASPAYYKNNVKVGLTPLILKNFAFSYERSLSRKISASVGYRYMPKTSLVDLPLYKQLQKYVEDANDQDLQDELKKMDAAGSAVTLEFRFYTGKKPGARGFYAAPYGRFSNMNFGYKYDYKASSGTILIPFQGDIKGIGGGLLLGTQVLIAKRIVLDVYIVGGHYGKLRGDVVGPANLSSLTPTEIADLQQDLVNIFTINDKQYATVSVSQTGVQMNIKGPFAGLRMFGISLGFAF